MAFVDFSLEYRDEPLPSADVTSKDGLLADYLEKGAATR